MIRFNYVPTITSEKHVTLSKDLTASITSFHVDVYEDTLEHGGSELIGTASVVLRFPEANSLFFKVVTKYENTDEKGSTYHDITSEELCKGHNEILKACKELKKAWG